MIAQNTQNTHFSIFFVLKWVFWGIVPCTPCIFADFLLLYIFCTKMGYLGVLGYIYTYGRKIKKKYNSKNRKKFIYIIYIQNVAQNTQNTHFSIFFIQLCQKQPKSSVIFFGKSEKNIWVLDFFEYNHWYRISKTVNQIYSWNSITVITADQI